MKFIIIFQNMKKLNLSNSRQSGSTTIEASAGSFKHIITKKKLQQNPSNLNKA